MEASSTSTAEEQEEKRLVETFCGITSSSAEEARFFLESHNWLIDAAVHSFFDADSPQPAPAAADQQPRNIHPRRRGESDNEEDDEDYIPRQPVLSRPSSIMSSSRDKKKPSKPSASRAGGIRTLADLNRQSTPGSDSDSDGPQEYYTGGEKSGMLVQDPSKGNNSVDAIFDQARQMGATQGQPVENPQPSSSRSFTGTGRLLSGESLPPAPEQPENVIHNIVFWTNGFTVSNGPLRRFDDPDNAPFLESIKKSECPKELEPADRRSAVHVYLTRRDENCPEPVQESVPFKGVGRTLGSGSSTDPSEPVVIASTTPSSSVLPPSSSVGLSVDDSLPSTSIQMRLADGTRMVARFNYHHTISDIRAFIDASRPGATGSYQLQTVGFPPKQLADATHTIEQAGLANSVVIQKL